MQRQRRRWWTWSVTLLASLIVLGALLSGLFQLAVMAMPGYREKLADYISESMDRPISIGGIALGWSGLSPRLELSDIALYGDDGDTLVLSAERLRIGFGLMHLLRGQRTPDKVELSGVDLALQIDEDGQFHLRGIDSAGGKGSKGDWKRELARFSSIELRDSWLTLEDARLPGETPRFHVVEAWLGERFGDRHVEISVELPRSIGETAELEAVLDGDLAKPETVTGRWSASLRKLSGLPWLRVLLPPDLRLQFADADLQLSGRIEQAQLRNVDLQLTAASLAAQRGKRTARFERIGVSAGLTRQNRSWTADISDLRLTGAQGAWPQSRVRLRWNPLPEGGQELEADTDYLRLQDLLPWIALSGEAAAQRIGGVSGELHGVVSRWRLKPGEPPAFSVRAQLDKLAKQAEGDQPGFAGLSGEISATETGGHFSLKNEPFQLSFARVFATPLAFERLGGELDWLRTPEGWQLDMPAYSWELAGSQGKGDLKLFLPADVAQSAQIKLGARFSARDATRLKAWAPLHWGEGLRNWLQRSIQAGRVPNASLKIEGKLSDFPFRDNNGPNTNGVFLLDLDMADARIAFAPDWPEASKVNGRLQFRGGGLSFESDSGELSGAHIERVSGDIRDFRDPLLTLDGEAQGTAPQFYDFVRGSPMLAKRLSGLLDQTTVEGQASTLVHVEVPLRDSKSTQVNGRVRLNQVVLRYKALEEPFRDIAGEIAFDNRGADGQGLRGTWYGVPVQAALERPAEGVTRLQAAMDYRVAPDGSGPSQWVPTWLRPRLAGSSHWTGRVDFGGDANGVLELQTDLRGVGVDLPKPLTKAADATSSLRLRLGALQDGGLRLGIAYGGQMGGDLWFPSKPAAKSAGADADAPVTAAAQPSLQPTRVLLRLGTDEIPKAGEEGLRLIGRSDELDLSAWLAVMNANNQPGNGPGLRLEQADLDVNRLLLYGQSTDKLNLSYRPRGDGWATHLQGEGGEGDLIWSGTSKAPALQARLKRLRLSDRPRTEPQLGTVAKEAVKVPLDPNTLPTLDIDCSDFSLGGAKLGRVRVLSERIDGGQRLSSLVARGADLDLQASGEWRRRNVGSSAQASFEGDSRATAPLLRALGYAATIEAQRGHFKGNLQWQPAPAGLDWAMANGSIDLNVERGALKTLDPGAGRALGLFNFYALPRRLTLDFRDVVDKGLAFDRIEGRFDLAGGNATTQKLEIRAPSLKMEMKGRIGLAARDYDQRVTVYPDVSGGVTLGALLLGGPALGVVALLAQSVLDKPLDQVTQFTYAVTGSWENPQVKRVEGG